MANASNTSEDSLEIQWVDTDVAIVFFVLNMIICLASEFLLYLLIKLSKRQNTFFEKLLGCYGMFNIVCTPIVVVLVDGVIGVLPISTKFGDWFCNITVFISIFWGFFNKTFSFFLVCMIYVGSVHEAKVNYRGKQFVINLFCMLSFGIPLICTFISLPIHMHEGSAGYDIWVGKCYGKLKHRNTGLCSFHEDILNQEYGEWGNSVITCLRILCWISFSCELVLASNIPEAIFYYLIYSHIRWYVSVM